MGYQDRRYRDSGDFGEGGGIRRAFRRIFVEGDGFMNWALPLYRLWGISVRVHLLFIILIIIKLLSPVMPGAIGFAFTAFFIGAVFLFVLLHEYGHCFACRAVGGEADDILMWPLGGLASCRPPHEWKAALLTTLGGPAVNVVLAAIFAAVLLALNAGWGVVLFNPLNMSSSLVVQPWFRENAAHWKYLLFFCYSSNVYLALFNLLLPMFPMDSGRIVQELLWWRLGYKKSMVIATTLGLIVAMIVGAYAILAQLNSLLGIAVFAGFTCYQQKQQLAFMEPDEPWAESLRPVAAKEDRKYAAAVKQQERDRAKQAEVDRILAKIAEQGMASLSRAEKNILKEATERKRAGA